MSSSLVRYDVCECVEQGPPVLVEPSKTGGIEADSLGYDHSAGECYPLSSRLTRIGQLLAPVAGGLIVLLYAGTDAGARSGVARGQTGH